MKRFYHCISLFVAALGSILPGCGGRGPDRQEGSPPPRPEREIRWVGQDGGYRGRTVRHADGRVENTESGPDAR